MSKLITRAVLDLKTNTWIEEESHDYDGPWAYAGAPGTFTQDSYRVYEEGTESGATPIAAVDTAADVDVDTNFQIRVLMQEGSANGDDLETPFFEYDLDNTTIWNPVTISSSVIKAVSSTSLTDGGDTTSLLTGSGSFIGTNAWVTEDGTVPLLAYAGSDYCEALLSCSIVSGDVTNGQVITVRLWASKPVPTWPATATINVVEGGGPAARRRSNIT